LVCHIRKYVIILGDIPVDVPPTKTSGGMCPRHPGGVDASGWLYHSGQLSPNTSSRAVFTEPRRREVTNQRVSDRQPCLNLANGVPYYEQRYSSATHTHTHPFNGPFSGTTQVNRYQKSKPICILLEQETVSGSGISWAVCKSAPRSIQITTPAPHHSVFYRPDALSAAQPTASKH